MKVAVIGTQGVPANYGGFESLVENLLGDNCPPDIEYTVFCSSKDMPERRRSHKGARLCYVPLHANGYQSIPYDIVSMAMSLRGFDSILILGVSGCFFVPMLRLLSRSRIIVNIDGLDHRRDKWGKLARWVLRTSEALAVRFSHVIITDNKGIQDYVTETYSHPSTLIAYGGDQVIRATDDSFVNTTLDKYRLRKGEYGVTVCRIEPENNCDMILEAFAHTGRKLVFIGNWDHSEWSRELRSKYSGYDNLLLLDAIYDLDILYALRSSAGFYLHGHSAGGTNPSLVEAMFFGIPIYAFDVIYNRETTENRAYYFKTTAELERLILDSTTDGRPMREIADRRYTWSHIAAQYCDLFR